MLHFSCHASEVVERKSPSGCSIERTKWEDIVGEMTKMTKQLAFMGHVDVEIARVVIWDAPERSNEKNRSDSFIR